MGRLFWKFFFSFWLTLLITAVSAGTFVWLKSAANHDDDLGTLKLLDHRGISYVMVAADIAKTQGKNALQNFLQQLEQANMTNVMAVNTEQQDILGRSVDLATLNHARQLFERGKRRIVERVTLTDTSLLLYVPLAEPEPLHYFKKSWVLKHLPVLLMIVSALFASFLFSALLAWYFTRPIRHLKQAFSEVAEGKLDTRVSQAMGNRQDELADLGKNFDFMTSKIDALVKGQRQLLHDVSHELRSPLARMQAAIGIAQQQPGKVESILTRLDREAERISDLVGELLLISRMETGVEYGQKTDVDIAALVDEIVKDAHFEAEHKSVSIELQHNEDITLHGQQELLHRAIENVIRNAIKFSDTGDTIHIRSQRDFSDSYMEITVEDEGPGVPEADLADLFRPFFRGSQMQRKDGIGLGLTIAQQATTAHGGQILAENRSEGGLRMIIRLPMQHLTH
ncbi:ATP-binding protein [Methylophaga sp.]|uniref:ATP-binding protein n=1 Tax=Methylophaga sp. TaxID=2024840 RepID=UPI003F69D3DD